MNNYKETLANIAGVFFAIFLVIGWFQPEGYWWFIGLNPFDLSDILFSFLLNLFN